MQMTKNNRFCSFALGSTRVKFDVWPGPKFDFKKTQYFRGDFTSETTFVCYLLAFWILLYFLSLYSLHDLASFNAVFTNLGASGRNGPASLGSHYTGQDHDGQVTLSSGIQQWTVPYTGNYRIEAIGAAGGYGKMSNNGQYRGRGARMIGTFTLSKDEIMSIVVGQEGGINTAGNSAGGGGGTFVVKKDNTPLIIAGGGGGMEALNSRQAGCDASTSTTGNPGHKSWSGGSGGQGATTADSGNSGESILH